MSYKTLWIVIVLSKLLCPNGDWQKCYVIAGLFFVFTIVKMKGPNKSLTINILLLLKKDIKFVWSDLGCEEVPGLSTL